MWLPTCRAFSGWMSLMLVAVVLSVAGRAGGADVLGEKELASGRDPSFESVSRHFPAMKLPREVIGVKEHRDEFIIMPDGRVAFTPSREGYYWRGYIAAKSGRAFFSLDEGNTWLGQPGSGMLTRKRLLDGYMPIVIAEFEPVGQSASGLKFEQTAVAWSEGMSPDRPIWAFVRMTVANTSDRQREVALHWNVDYGADKERKVRKAASWKFTLAPGVEKTVYGKLPYLDGYEKAIESSTEEFDSRLAEAAGFWKELLSKGIRIAVPEARINDAYRAWLAYTFLNVDKIDAMYEPHDGSGFYESIFGIMAAKYCNALDLMGYPDDARKYLDSLGTLISPEGHFKVAFGTVDTGVLLLVMANHYQLTGDRKWLEAAAPRMVKMCDWIIAKRKGSMAEQQEGALCYGLISSNVGVDNPGADYSYVTDTALCVGMEATVQALLALGKNDEAERIRNEATAYRRDIEASMRKAVTEHEGLKILPVMPKTHKYLKRAEYKTHVEAGPGEGYTGHGYYALFGSIVLETAFLPATDETFRLIAQLMEKRDGLAMGMCAFGGKGGIDHAFTYGYWMNCLERGEPERAILGLYGSLAYGMSRDTWAGVECTNMIHGANAATLPHLRSGTQQLRLLRNMLVREDANRLLLAQAVPQHWLTDGQEVQIEDAPTRFGKVSYSIHSHTGDGRIEVRITPPKRTPPVAIVVYLRHPDGKPIRSATANGEAVKSFDAGSVTLDKVMEPVTIQVNYE